MERVSQTVRRAAVVIELEDGTRMLYEFKPGRQISLEMLHHYPDTGWGDLFSRTSLPQDYETTMTVEGTLERGTIWQGDMPGEDRQELGPQSIEQ